LAQELRESLKKEKISAQSVDRTNNTRILVKFSSAADAENVKSLLDKDFTDLKELSRSQEGDSVSLILGMSETEMNAVEQQSVDQALETIRNRIDQFGVSEPDIRREGQNRLLIQLPGIQDSQRAKELIGKTALLEFKLVDDQHDVESAIKGTVPPGLEVLYDIKGGKTAYLVKKRSLLTGAYLTHAKVNIDSQYREPYVSIEFDKKGARLFEKITEENVKKRLAIVLDNKVYSAPVIQEKISGGQARITGRFTSEEARDLAIVLRAGALPAPVNIMEERTVGPSLGTDSIHKGLIAGLIGGFLVMVFMLLYYKLSGLMADVALIVNLLLMAAGLAAFQATLTLPGIAGFILTIGMAVDANVLIFERIREELAIGKSPRAAIEAGYERSSLTIFDANVTTLIAAVVMFQFGTGPIKGFAITLSLGVIASVFTALVLTREVYEYFLIQRKIKTISI
jgi:preprotein translocase subunit SecD